MKPLRKHRITSVQVWKKEGNAGFTLTTKNGTSAFVFGNAERTRQGLYKLRFQLPHLEDEIIALLVVGAGVSELSELLVGRYLYGYVAEQQIGDQIFKIIL